VSSENVGRRLTWPVKTPRVRALGSSLESEKRRKSVYLSFIEYMIYLSILQVNCRKGTSGGGEEEKAPAGSRSSKMNDDNVDQESSMLLPATAVEGYSSIAADTESGIEENNDESSTSFAQDVVDTFHLAIPIFISRVSYVGVRVSCLIPTVLSAIHSQIDIFLSIDEDN
jgi:hypothetical protein